MSAPPLRRSTRNAAKRDSPAVDTTTAEVVAPAPKKKRTAPAAAEKKAAAAPVEKKAAAPKKTAAPKKAAEKVTAAASAVADAVAPAIEAATAAVSPELKEGDVLPANLPEIQKHTGETTTLKALLSESTNGIVIFAYPKASTPGCTTQACAFRDSSTSFKTAGYALYGLSGDSPAANEKFQTKHNMTDIVLLCDPKYELHARLGVKKAGAAKGTVRSVVVISKEGTDGGKLVKRSPATPAASVDMALKAIGGGATDAAGDDKKEEVSEAKEN